MLFCNAKSRYELPKVFFAERIFKQRQSEIRSLRHSKTIPSRILFHAWVSSYYNFTCLYFDSRVLVFNSKFSCAPAMFSDFSQAPSATFLIKAFFVPLRSWPELSFFSFDTCMSWEHWNFTCQILIFFVNLFCSFWHRTLVNVYAAVFLLTQLTQAG